MKRLLIHEQNLLQKILREEGEAAVINRLRYSNGMTLIEAMEYLKEMKKRMDTTAISGTTIDSYIGLREKE